MRPTIISIMALLTVLALAAPAEANNCPQIPLPNTTWEYPVECFTASSLPEYIACVVLIEGLAWDMISNWHNEMNQWIIDCLPAP